MEPGALGLAAEFGDIRPGDKRAPFAIEHYGLHRVVGEGGRQAIKKALAHAAGQRVYGRVVDAKDGEFPIHGIMNRTFHVALPCYRLYLLPAEPAPLTWGCRGGRGHETEGGRPPFAAGEHSEFPRLSLPSPWPPHRSREHCNSA